MWSAVSDFVRKVFPEEEASLVTWLRGRELIKYGAVLIAAIIFAYFKWPQAVIGAGSLIIANFYALLIWLLLVWLLLLTIYIYRRDKVTNEREFIESFESGTRNWEYYGGWQTEREDNHTILIVTDSDAGGFAKPCRLWNDYTFEFETKIVQSNTSWVIRAGDILNYVMLQCSPTELIPHFRAHGIFFGLPSVSHTKTLPLNRWFGVKIRVSGIRVVATVTIDGEDTELLNSALLEPMLKRVQVPQEDGSTEDLDIVFSYPLGSVGFREYSPAECAHFRNVRVTRI